MPAVVKETSRKIILDLKEGTQTVSPILESATDDKIYEVGQAVATLQASSLEEVKLVITETIGE